MEVLPVNYMPGDPLFIDKIVYELKSQGMFDGFRRECMSDVDTKPAYQNLRQRVESAVNAFLRKQKWNPEMNKNHVREQLRKNLCESGFLEPGVERIVDQVVNPKTNSIFLPKVTDIVYENLGLERPNTSHRSDKNLSLSVENLLPHDLEAVSPESSGMDDKMDSLQSLDEGKMEEDESPPFEPIEENVVGAQEENSIDSHLSGFSGLVSHDSNQSDSQKPLQIDADTQMSKPSSDGRLSAVEEHGAKMDVGDDSKGFEPESSDKSSSSNKSDKKEHRKDERRSDKDKDRRDKEKERSRDKDKSKSDKHKSRSSSHGEKRDDKKSDRDKKDKYVSSSKDKDRSRDSSSRKDSKSKHKSSSSSKHSSSSDKKKESSKDKSKDRKDHRDSKDKKSSSSSKDDKSRSSSHSHDKYKKSSSSSRKDKDKKRRDKDDHFSSKHRPERRSTDRDSNDGSGLKSSSSSYSESNSSSQNSTHVAGGGQKTQEVNSNTDSGNSDAVERRRAVTLGPEQLGDELVLGASSLKLIKPKIASNIHEARRLMKIRKQLKQIEMQGEYALEALKRKEEKKEVRKGLSVSMDKWNELEAKLNESVNFDAYYDPESFEEPKPECNEVKPGITARNNGDTTPAEDILVDKKDAESSVKENETVEVVTTVDVSENIVPLEVSENNQIPECKAPEAVVEMDTEVELNAEVEPNSEAKVNAEVEVNSDVKLNTEVEVNSEVEMNAELELNAEVEVNDEVEQIAEVESNAEVEIKVDVNGEVKQNSEVEVNDEVEQIAEVEPNAEVEIKAEVEVNAEVELNAEVEQKDSTATIETTAAIAETPQTIEVAVEAVSTTSKPDCNDVEMSANAVDAVTDTSNVINDDETSAEPATTLVKGPECNRQQTDEDSPKITPKSTDELAVMESSSEVTNELAVKESSSKGTKKLAVKESSSKVTNDNADINKEPEISSDMTDDKTPESCDVASKEDEITPKLKDQKPEDLLYFPTEEVRDNDARAKAMLGYVGKLKREIEEIEAKMALRRSAPELGDVNKENKRAGVKRKTAERNESVVRKLRNNNNLVDVTAHDEKFSMPLSPAESDKSVDKKIETDTQARVVEKPPPSTVSLKKRVSKRYTSEDLYKPRPLIKRTTRSRRGAQLD